MGCLYVVYRIVRAIIIGIVGAVLAWFILLGVSAVLASFLSMLFGSHS